MIKQSKAMALAAGIANTKKNLPILSTALVQNERLIVTDLTQRLMLDLPGVMGEGLISGAVLKVCGDQALCFDDSGAMVAGAISYEAPTRDNGERMTVADFPLEDMTTDAKYIVKAVDLLKALETVRRAMAKDDVRYYLDGALFTDSRIVATDGHRLSIAPLSPTLTVAPAADAIVPRGTVLTLIKLLKAAPSNDVTFARSDKFVSWTGAGWVLSSHIVDGRYPDIDRVMPCGGTVRVVFDVKRIQDTLKALKPMLNAKYSGIVLDLVAGTIAPGVGQGIACFTGNPAGFAIGFNSEYILDALASVGTPMVELVFTDKGSSVLIAERHVVMPMRL